MILNRNNKTIEVSTRHGMYLFLNERMIIGSDKSMEILESKVIVLKTLSILGIKYKTELNSWQDEEGSMHIVNEIKTD